MNKKSCWDLRKNHVVIKTFLAKYLLHLRQSIPCLKLLFLANSFSILETLIIINYDVQIGDFFDKFSLWNFDPMSLCKTFYRLKQTIKWIVDSNALFDLIHIFFY